MRKRFKRPKKNKGWMNWGNFFKDNRNIFVLLLVIITVSDLCTMLSQILYIPPAQIALPRITQHYNSFTYTLFRSALKWDPMFH